MGVGSVSGGEAYGRLAFRAMNTDICAAFRCRQDQLDELGSRVPDWFRYVESRFSRFVPDSELSRLNRSSGRLCAVSDTMLEVLLLAQGYAERTSGIFNPFVLAALTNLGYDDSFDEVKRRERVTVAASSPTAPGAFSEQFGLRIDAAMKSVRLPLRSAVDLGGIVKSWSVQRLAGWLRQHWRLPCGLLNAGGDLTVWGEPPDQADEWRIGIEDPWNPGEDIGVLLLREGSVATSGTMRRQWMTDRGRMHHLIDPRTMCSSGSDVVQCTVTGNDLVACEIWAKVICIAGMRQGFAMMKASGPDFEAVALTGDGRFHYIGDPDSLAGKWSGMRMVCIHG